MQKLLKLKMSFCYDFNIIFWKYIYIVISCFGFILNTICVIAFLRAKFLKTDLFKYLFIKSICDTFIFIRNIIHYTAENCGKSCFLVASYEICLIRYIIYHYFTRIIFLVSMFCDLATILDRYVVITNRLQVLNKIHIKIKILSVFIYGSLFYIYVLFDGNCYQEKENYTNITYFSFAKKNFRETGYGAVLEVIHATIRDVICILLIALFNILTFVYLRNSFKMNKNNTKTGSSNKQKAENNLTYMIITTSCINIVGHFLLFVNYLPIDQIINNICMKTLSTMLLFLSFSINFFSYYWFNNHFKNYINFNCAKLISFVTFDRIRFQPSKYALSSNN